MTEFPPPAGADDLPAYRQVYRHLREMILSGSLAPGERLAPTRTLARQLGVSRITVVQAYEQLAAEGLVRTRVGAGTFVSDDLASLHESASPVGAAAGGSVRPLLTDWGRRAQRLAPATESVEEATRPEIDFGFGRSFAQSFPYDVWRRLLARYLSTDDAMLSRYGSAAGFYPLRRAIADYLVRERGVRATAEQVVIVSGAQQALDILARLTLRPGDEVVVETPGYRDAFALFRLHDARLIGLPVDDQGLPVDLIPAGCRARLAFVTPAHQFPRGGTMPLSRRVALLNWARRRGALIVEDDYDGELRYEPAGGDDQIGGHPISALQGLDDAAVADDGRVIYLGTFSKVLFPALRLGYLVLPQALLAPFVQAKDLVDRGAPTLTQAAVADFINEGHFERHLRHLRRLYGERRQALVAALERYLPGRAAYSQVAAGLHVMLYLEPWIDESKLIREAARLGVRIYPGATYHLERPAPPSVLLGFSGLSVGEIEEGARRLATALDACAG